MDSRHDSEIVRRFKFGRLRHRDTGKDARVSLLL